MEPNLRYKYTKEIAELWERQRRIGSNLPIDIRVLGTKFLPSGDIEVTYDLTAEAQLNLEVLRFQERGVQ